MIIKLATLLVLVVATLQCLAAPKDATLDDIIKGVFDTDDSENHNSQTNGEINVKPVEDLGPAPAPQFTEYTEDEHTGTCEAGFDCVSYYLCKDNQIVTDGTGVIDIRIDDNESDGPKKCSYLETCCPKESKSSEVIYIPPPTHNDGCGFRNSDGIGFKITGDKNNETEYGEFPWMVAVLKEEQELKETLNIYQCGGSLITPTVVLTAAHCVVTKPPNSLKVRAGEWDTQTKKEMFVDQDRNVVDVVIHEQFYKGGLFNDIALLFVDKPFILQDNVQTICLPPHGVTFDYSRCYATGWGKDTFGAAGQYQVILKKIDLPIVPNAECQKKLRKTRLGKHFELHESFLCAGGEIGKDTCKGDGGSPLVCPIKNTVNRYYQAGIVAWGIGCGDSVPGVYASVSHLRPWIDTVLENKRIDSKYFTP